MNTFEISVNQYLNMSEYRKQIFYSAIVKDNPRTQKTTTYATKINPAKQAKIPDFLSHQEKGKLQFVAPLYRTDKKVNGLYFLAVCDCGNWEIVEGLKYRNEEQITCVPCALRNITTMKDISGEIYGQLQAIAPLSKRGSDGSVYWKCRCVDCGHEQEVIKNNLRKNKGHLCAVCGEKSKGEYKVAKMLQELNMPFEKEKIFSDCIFEDSNGCARFDFYVNNTYIIEIDGQHHFFPVSYGGNVTEQEKKLMYQKVLEHDRYKNKYCRDNDIPLIRIPYFSLDALTYQDLDIKTSKFLVI